MSKKNKGVAVPVKKQVVKNGQHHQNHNHKKKEVNPLEGARFRWLNESLYTESGDKSFDLFQRDPSLFKAYHNGFRAQASGWPVNPVDEICNYITSNLTEGSVIGDFGCGDAQIAQKLGSIMKVHSFDLVSVNSLVTACNIADVPLEDGVLDMAVFSLSLMGTDWPKFVNEASRCLKIGGILYIAEVQSRMVDFEKFRASLSRRFKVVVAENIREKYFVKLIMSKSSNKPVDIDSSLLKPCLYKKR
jgi:ribosomal RNA-processing protein 8